eukprot:4445243-Amphidinium_carterae.1
MTTLASQRNLAVRIWQGQWLVCSQTHEVILLPVAEHAWSLNFASDGLAYVTSGADALRVSSLQRHLVLQQGSSLVVQSHASPGGQGPQLFRGSLSDASTHKLGPAELSIAKPNMLPRTFVIQRFLVPQNGAMCFIDLKDLYSRNQLQTSKYPGTWIRLRLGSWKKCLQEIGFPHGHVREGAGTEVQQGQVFEAASLSLPASLVLLSRWSSKGKPAMQSEHDHTACEQMLEVLLSLLEGQELPLHFSMGGCSWQGDGFLDSTVQARKVKMVSCVVKVDELPLPVQTLVSQGGIKVVEKVQVKYLLQLLAVEKDLHWFYFQLALQIGCVLDLQVWLRSFEANPPPVDTKAQMRKQIQRYTTAALTALSGKQFLSMSVGASRVGQKKTLLGFFGTATGVAAMAPPQVVMSADFTKSKTCVLEHSCWFDHGLEPCFRVVVTESVEREDQAKKYRKFAQSSAAWLKKRKAEKDTHKGPVKVQRKATYQWLRAVNHMTEIVTGESLMRFQPVPALNPRSWPCLSIAADHGSDATAAYYFMVNKLKMNVELWPDSSHQWQRDIINSWNGLKWKGWTQCMVAVLNFQHGPWEGASRYHELQATSHELFTCLKSESHPFLVKYQSEILQELDMDNVETEEGLHSRIVEVLEEHPSLRHRGTKTAMCRFANFVDSCRCINKCWTFYLLRLLFLAFELKQLEGVVMKTAMSNALQGAEQNAEARQTVQQPPTLRKAFTSNLAFEGWQKC